MFHWHQNFAVAVVAAVSVVAIVAVVFRRFVKLIIFPLKKKQTVVFPFVALLRHCNR